MLQANPFEVLDLSDYACQELLVSFAVSNVGGLSSFSSTMRILLNGGNFFILIQVHYTGHADIYIMYKFTL